MENKKGLDTRKKCPICRRRYEGPGHDALPVWPGRCCDRCNQDFVIPMRMILLRRQMNEENESGKSEENASK